VTQTSPRRRTRAESQEANRRALLDAARALVGEDPTVRLETLAEAAGLTTGAVYSIFGSKSDLLFALLVDELGRADLVAPLLAEPELSLPQAIGHYVDTWQAAYAGDAKGQAAFELNVMLSALDDERLLEQLAEALAGDVEQLAAALEGRAVGPDDARVTGPAEAREVAEAVKAVLTGFGLRRPVSGDTSALARRSCVALAGLVADHDRAATGVLGVEAQAQAIQRA
jgi:AcrR family transcriptional regulator